MGSVNDTPVDDGFIDVAAGARHSLALREDGTIVAWGWDMRGEVSETPADPGFVAISVGYTHSLALHRDGYIVAWGWDRNNAGQTRDVPKEGRVTTISAGEFHNLAIRPK